MQSCRKCCDLTLIYISSCIISVVTSLFILDPPLDVYNSQMNGQTIDLYLDRKSPKMNFRIGYRREFHATTLIPFEYLCCISMRSIEIV